MEKDMRVFVLAAMLLASSSLWSSAEEPGKAPAAAPQAGTPAQTDQNSQPQQDRQNRTRPTEDRRPRDRARTLKRAAATATARGATTVRWGAAGRCVTAMAIVWAVMTTKWVRTGEGMTWTDDVSRDREPERGDRDWDRADRDRDNRGYVDADRPRRRVKVCVEYDNGDEYCRYRQ